MRTNALRHVFTRTSAAALIKFFKLEVRHLFEFGYIKAVALTNFFLPNAALIRVKTVCCTKAG